MIEASMEPSRERDGDIRSWRREDFPGLASMEPSRERDGDADGDYIFREGD